MNDRNYDYLPDDRASLVREVANLNQALKESQAEVERLWKENADLSRWLEEARGERLYCPTCGGCGEAGCCDPCGCVRVRCDYGDTNMKEYREICANIDARDTLLRQTLTAMEGAKKALDHWKAEYEKRLDESDKEIAKWKAEDDFYGVNFWQGHRSVLVYNDISLGQLKRAIPQLQSTIADVRAAVGETKGGE